MPFPERVEVSQEKFQLLIESDEIDQALFTEILPGVMPYGSRIMVPEDPETYEKKLALQHMHGIVELFDVALEHAEGIDVQPRLLQVKFTEDEVRGQQGKFISVLNKIYQRYSSDHLAFALPLNGSIPIIEDMIDIDIDTSYLHPVHISGSKGATTGEAEVQLDLPENVLDPEKMVVFTDDVLDSGVSVIQLALERRKKRLGEEDKYSDLVENIQEHRKKEKLFTHPDLEREYARAAELLQEEKVVVGALYWKNISLFEALDKSTYSNDPDDWQIAQHDLLQATNHVGEKEWIMGGRGRWEKPLLDTGIKWEKEDDDDWGLKDFIDEKFHSEIKRLGIDKMIARIGAGWKSLYIFNPDGIEDAEKQLVQLFAQVIEAYMERRTELEESQAPA